ncbi:MAG: TonB-dependent receptor [Cyclobacteriaceae bacterium]|nr:TonB-dependent receptor [Cyclobacteriaceae bacterium]MCX7638064.1 TonB-dependent receptor [Cyclobacteriaceae bacterium]MDW8331929.1 carboxypeptidase-like regulatory domain-containing protein [Cyclobacteriaceae bacterium]
MRQLCAFICFLSGVLVVYAQMPFNQAITIRPNELPLSFSDFVIKAEQEGKIKFFYNPDWVVHLYIEQPYENMPVGRILEQILTDSDIRYFPLADYGIILVKDPTIAMVRAKLLEEATARKRSVQRVVIGNPVEYRTGKKVQLEGRLTDDKTGFPVKNATIEVLTAQTGTSTSEQGQFTLTLTAGTHVLSVRHNNYAEKVLDLEIYSNGKVDFVLEEVPVMLDEVVVTDQAVVNSSLTTTTLKVTDLKRSPVFLGEVDIVRQLQNQPGVTSVGEVAGGFNVRGGGPDQNLILYDGIQVFNTTHALGFFSAFNADAVQRVRFYKGSIPAEFGGRASSVLEVTSREGDPNRWKGSGGIGFLSSFFSLGGPLKKEKTTLMTSVRSTYSDWVLNTINSNYTSLKNSLLSFYDGSVKLTHNFSEKSKLTFSGYLSRDRMRLITDTLFQWNNALGSISFSRNVNPRFYYTLQVGTGTYAYRVEEPAMLNAFRLSYSMFYPSFRADFSYGDDLPLNFGLQGTWYTFYPGVLKPLSPASNVPEQSVPAERAVEAAPYVGKSFQVIPRLNVDLGLRYALYAQMGPDTVFTYQPDVPREEEYINGFRTYGSGKVIRFYQGAEPRISAVYKLSETRSVKAGFNRMYQFVHLISNTLAVTPADIWKLSDTYIQPQRTDHISAGYFQILNDNLFEISAEGFYKHMVNVLDFKDGALLILNNKLETALLPGTGRAYGIELSATKNRGRLQGNINYTFSRSLRKINGRFDSEKINNGSWFPANFDQPHIVNLSWRYGISRRHFFSGNFTYHTGRPLSLPAHIYYVDGIGISDFPERNTYRLRDYHRLDLAFIIEGNHKRKKIWDGTWIVSFYNVYARKNPYSVFFREDEYGILKPYQLAVIGTIVPSVTYMLKF